MASSLPATSSPARSSTSPDRFALSPQSRLKRLLATVDSDSDDADIPRTTFGKRRSSRQVSPSSSRGHDASIRAPGDETRPQGQLLGRAQNGTILPETDARERVRKMLEKGTSKPDVEMTGTNEEADSENEDDIIRPRGRFAGRMMGGEQSTNKDATRVTKSPINTSATEEPGDVEMNDDDDDEDLLIVRRRLKTRQRQSQAPETRASTPQRKPSPGLFVTPSKSPSSAQENPAAASESDADLPTLKSDRFKALVEKKRQERLAREAEEEKKREARAAALAELGDDKDDDVSDITDDEGGRQLTQRQKPRPSRKASKKAIEEMNRETQRMQRAMQLAHEAKTKKKIAKSSLFERFNFKPGGSVPSLHDKQSSSRPQTPGSTKSTDAEMQEAGTPPSSPPARVEDVLGKDLSAVSEQTGAGASTTTNKVGQDSDADAGLPDIIDIQAFARKPLDKGKDIATTPDLEIKKSTKPIPKRQVRVKMPPLQANRASLGSDDEDDLVIVNTKKTRFDAIFDRLPKTQDRESKALRLQRQLAHIDSPERKAYKKTDKKAMTPGELQMHLNQRAREQAKLERERRMEMLKAKGIHIQTEEERERDREAVEDMVLRARREAEEIMDRERGEAKAAKKAARGDDPIGWDDSDSDDDDYVENEKAEDAGSVADVEADAGIELSGSEEEEEEEEEEDNADAEGMLIDGDDDDDQDHEQTAQVERELTPIKISTAQPIVELAGEASDGEDKGSDTEQSWVDPDEEEEKHRWGGGDEDTDTPAFVQARRPKQPLAVLSDNEDLGFGATPEPPRIQSSDFTPRPTSAQAINFTPRIKQHTSPDVPTSVLRSATKTFIPGMPVNLGGPAGLGLTQIFAGTMDDSQAGSFDGSSPSQPMPTFENFPDSQFSQNATDSSDAMVFDSQTVPATQGDSQEETQIRLDFSQSQMHGLNSLLRDDLGSQPSQMMEPTQDGGFQDWTPLKERFVEAPQSTVDTVIRGASQPQSTSLPEAEMEDMSHESPLMRKRSRIRRRAVVASDTEDGDDLDSSSSKPNVFNAMKDAAVKEKKRKAREEFDKRKSHAKEMVHEQADESEDEYAGLGGVDGEDSDDDGSDVKEMIDDQTEGNKDDELKISALYAERERVEDAKQTDKLFNDITRGMLRRKRGGADYDLSDSDDGGEAKRRMKRRQFAKMQKALFADERISKVAENPRNQAFMRTIEDIGSDDEMDFLFAPAPQPQTDSQTSGSGDSQEQGVTVPDSQPPVVAGVAAGIAAPPKRAPANERRTKTDRKPATLGEIRETLSNLLDEPSNNTVISSTDFSSDGGDSASDGEGSTANKENTNPRRSGPVVDRISLKRQGSSNASASGGSSSRMAFFAAPSSSASANGGFKVPALLRKATTNSLISTGSGSSHGGGSAGAGGFGEDAKIKKNAGKRSGVSYLARETDRRAKLVEGEKRREERKFKAVEGRVKVVGGLFGRGKFE